MLKFFRYQNNNFKVCNIRKGLVFIMKISTNDYNKNKIFSSILYLIVLIHILAINANASLCDITTGTDVVNNIWEDTIWLKVKSPYCISDDIKIIKATLTIEPGVVVKFKKGNISNPNQTFSLIIDENGKIIARGTETEKIIFTSNETEPKIGDWNSINFTSSSIPARIDSDGNYIDGSIFENVEIKYALGNNYGAISSETLPLLLNDITFYQVETGIVINKPQVLSNITFRNCLTKKDLIRVNTSQVIDKTRFINCESKSSHIISVYASSESYSLTIINSSFENIKPSQGSGCIFSKIEMYLNNCVFQDIYGHAISSMSSSLYIENTTFNYIDSYALGVSSSPFVSVINCNFNNVLRAIRSGIYEESDSLKIINSTVKNCIESAVTGFKKNYIKNSDFINNCYDPNYDDATIEARELTLTNCLVFKSQRKGILIYEKGRIDNSTIAYNFESGIRNEGDVEISNSNIFENAIDFFNYSPKDITATNNYWGTTSFQTIKLNIYDKNDNNNCGVINYHPFSNTFVINSPPVPPWCDVFPDKVDFGYVPLNESSSPKEIILSNSVITNLHIDNNIEEKTPFGSFNNNCLNQVIGKDQNCKFDIIFQPTSVDRFEKSISIPSDSVIQKNIHLTGYSRIDEGFEPENIDQYNWEMKGNADWIINNNIYHTGNYCIQSPIPITDNQSNSLSLSLNTEEGLLSFYYNITTKHSCVFNFYVDNKEVFRAYYNTNGWKLHTELLQKGFHTLKWKFKSYLISEPYLYLDTMIFPKENNSELKPISITPEKYNFGTSIIDKSVSKTFIIKNNSPDKMLMSSFMLLNNCKSFKLSNDNCSNNNLLSNNECSFDIVFQPQLIGIVTDNLKVNYNDNLSKLIFIEGEGIGVDVSITGKVTFSFENYLNLPIQNASINIQELDYSTYSDENGIFTIHLNNIFPKQYAMTVSTIDFYKTIYLTISKDTENVIDIGNINMKCINKKISLKQIIKDLQVLSGSIN